jgi:hypothetical protein
MIGTGAREISRARTTTEKAILVQDSPLWPKREPGLEPGWELTGSSDRLGPYWVGSKAGRSDHEVAAAEPVEPEGLAAREVEYDDMNQKGTENVPVGRAG